MAPTIEIEAPVAYTHDSLNRLSTVADNRLGGSNAAAHLWRCQQFARPSIKVSSLRLIDTAGDEKFCVKRAKRGGYQRYPLQCQVGEAILRSPRVKPRCEELGC